MEFIATMRMNIVAATEDEARAKLHDLIWRHYGVRCTSELDARINLNIVSARPDNKEVFNTSKLHAAWSNICREGMDAQET